jgi:hypothetical protein
VRVGVGLIVFDIVVHDSGNFTIENLKLVQKAERRTPDPLLVQRYLENRFTLENRDKLIELAHGKS